MTKLGERMLIGGELVTAAGGRTFDNINPATEEVIGTAPEASAADVERAIKEARRAFDTTSWSTDTELRRRCLVQLRDALRANVEELRSMVVAEIGVPVMLTGGIALEAAIGYFDHYINLLDTYAFERTVPTKEIFGTPVDRIIRREAVGVVAAITPWNYPFYLNICKVGAALAAGCTVVLKPAPDSPWSALALGAIAAEHTDIPAGVLNVISTSDTRVASLLTSHPDVDAVTLTGSTVTGRRVMAAAADTVKRVTLELGGKSAAVLLDDAPLETIIPALAGGVCVHAGQGCTQLTRLLVPRSRLDEAVGIAASVLPNIPWGDPTDPSSVMGPVINAAQRDSILRYYESAARDGRVVVGGKPTERFAKGYFVEPTLITDIDPKATVAQEEIFGPALVVLPYDDDEDALRIADGTIFGLSAAVYSADTDRAMTMARRFRSGTVSVNGAPWFDVESPFGGYKQSGIGREWGTEGLEDFLEVKTISFPPVAG
ncbi:aldehyde dehydrogenase family protein [Actinocorallia sp. A-T 12471]|uniref:aldehyde dehydrogenase family protein n=1 Tax=Actinocorallia sp. A-T 12471 TaxID=3089813 RepID=UPI0029CC7145|nr:aldehyde dehydrogenase family protein [Actinocorallia sp. A-T 12471]MDX6742150.1 aldehyde dehydrogenase family protein [Actinocorallia sp. A-T 12471]